jgi:hypothetical protein
MKPMKLCRPCLIRHHRHTIYLPQSRSSVLFSMSDVMLLLDSLNHSWYKNVEISGVKRVIIAEALFSSRAF